MDFDFTTEQEAFRAEVETFLNANDDPDVFDPTRENMAQIVDTPKRRALMKKMGEQGWLGITWPKEYGGQEGEGVYEYILNEALAGRGGPRSARASESSARPSSPTDQSFSRRNSSPRSWPTRWSSPSATASPRPARTRRP